MGTRGLLLRSTIVAALGGLLFGFDTAVISGTTDALRKVFELTSQQLGFTVASALIGTILGAIAVGRPADTVGRRTTLIVMAVFYFVSAVGSAFPWDWYSFLGFRFLGGLAVGGASVVSPLYIAEISPARLRGRLVAVQQFNIVLGILLAFFSNYLLAGMELGSVTWRWMFGVEAFPAAAFFFLLFGIPQSPRWLVAKGRVEEASQLLAQLGTDTGSVQQEIDAIRQSLAAEHDSLQEPLLRRKYAKPILLAVLIAMFNQLSGINAVLYYAPQVFQMAGASEGSALMQTMAVGGTNLIVRDPKRAPARLGTLPCRP
jgi:sugar porter (SP) family MFS transporter